VQATATSELVEEPRSSSISVDIASALFFDAPSRLVTFKDIVGSISVIQSLRENVVYQFILPESLKRELFSGIRRGAGDVLLYGPPGCGKTVLV
jgi:SpoVK/Ycf46/Vps4 family AAA+-type ATPase